MRVVCDKRKEMNAKKRRRKVGGGFKAKERGRREVRSDESEWRKEE